MQVEGIKVNADEGGVTQTRGGVYWLILPAGCKYFLLRKHTCFHGMFHEINARQYMGKTCLLCNLERSI